MSAHTDLADMDKSWSDFLNGALEATERTIVLKKVASDFNAAVARHPESTALLESLGRVLCERPRTDAMWPVAERMLLLAYGPSAVRLMRWLVGEEDDVEQKLDEVATMLDLGSEMLLRDILARHSDDLIWSYYAWSYDAHEWRTISLVPRQSLDGSAYFINVMIEKVNGEKITFTSRSNQMLLFTRAILSTLNDLPPAAFTSPGLIGTFNEQARRVIAALSAISTASSEQASVMADGLTPDQMRETPIADEPGER